MISDLINSFLSNFNYLNTKGKRSGCLFFPNKDLTGDLEKTAVKIREELTALAQNNVLSEQAKGDAFFKIIHASFDKVEQARATHGHACNPRKNKPYLMQEIDGSIHTEIWVKPLKPARFEKQLVKGLNAVNIAIADQTIKQLDPMKLLPAFNRKCNELILEIHEFQRPDKCLAKKSNHH